MYLPTLQPAVNSDSYLHGDVSIHPKAAIASGVILQASPDSQIIIEEEVCIGMGVIINAYEGLVRIKKGAILGAGVLIIGKVIVGANSCVGASSTLINTNVESQAAIAPGTLLGDTSRQVELSGEAETELEAKDETPLEVREEVSQEKSEQNVDTTFPSPWDTVEDSQEQIKEEFSELEGEFLAETAEVQQQQQESKESAETQQQTPSTVVGKMYVNQLLVTLFPQNQNLKKIN
jgi:carbon dioxide concentrating mechanism protein CcmN